MIKGLSITPPILGRISIGRIVETNGRRLPEKDDQFTITSQVQHQDSWIPHPLDAIFREASSGGKLRAIPITLMFSEPELNLRAAYCMFDQQSGRPLCTGNGDVCKRVTATSVSEFPCPTPDVCEMAQGRCKPYGRLNVQIDAADELGSFIFRTAGYNSIRTLTARLHYYQAVSGNLLACLPLELRLRGKSPTQARHDSIYYVDLTIREGTTLESAITTAKQTNRRRLRAGYDQEALNQAARRGFANGGFEESGEEIPALVEEFFINHSEMNGNAGNSSIAKSKTSAKRQGLRGKLIQKAKSLENPSNSKTGED